jgi:hypothetical protein
MEVREGLKRARGGEQTDRASISGTLWRSTTCERVRTESRPPTGVSRADEKARPEARGSKGRTHLGAKVLEREGGGQGRPDGRQVRAKGVRLQARGYKGSVCGYACVGV